MRIVSHDSTHMISLCFWPPKTTGTPARRDTLSSLFRTRSIRWHNQRKRHYQSINIMIPPPIRTHHILFVLVQKHLPLRIVQIAPHLADHFAQLPQLVLRIASFDAVPHATRVPRKRHQRFFRPLGRFRAATGFRMGGRRGGGRFAGHLLRRERLVAVRRVHERAALVVVVLLAIGTVAAADSAQSFCWCIDSSGRRMFMT